MWVYHSSIGPLYIVPTGDGLFGFLYNGIIWEACPTPQIEADNVYCRATGCPDASNLEELPHEFIGVDIHFQISSSSPGSMLLRHRPGELCFCGTAAR